MGSRRPSAMPEAWRSLIAQKPDRFWDKVDKNGLNGCWIWTGSLNTGGYGQLGRRIDKRTIMILAHRFAYFLVKGEIPASHDVRHTCHEKLCCNPAHLYLKKVQICQRSK